MVRTFHRGYTIEISGVPLILYVAICGIATNSARLLWNDINRHLRENKTPESFCKFRNFLISNFLNWEQVLVGQTIQKSGIRKFL